MDPTSPDSIRLACRSGEYSSQTSGLAYGYAQANLCILSKEDAFDFMLFCQRNPKPCPCEWRPHAAALADDRA